MAGNLFTRTLSLVSFHLQTQQNRSAASLCKDKDVSIPEFSDPPESDCSTDGFKGSGSPLIDMNPCPQAVANPVVASRLDTKVIFVNNIQEDRPRDTTVNNIVRFFTRSWLPSQQFQWQEQIPDAYEHDVFSSQSRTEDLHSAKTSLNADSLERTADTCNSHSPAAEIVQRELEVSAAPVTPRGFCKQRFPESTPQKGHRACSLGGFCSPFEDGNGKCGFTKPVQALYRSSSDIVTPLSRDGITKTSEHHIGTPLKRKSSDVRSPAKQICDMNRTRARSNSHVNSGKHVMAKSAVVDLTLPDGTSSESEDELPLALLMERRA